MKPSRKSDILISLILFFLGIITRVPFVSRIFNYWDGPQFAIAMERYSLSDEFPAPPGHFLYLMIAKAINFLVKDANISLLIISIIGSGLFAVLVYWLGLTIFDRLKGLWAALIVLSAPWFWYYGLIAVPFMLTGFLAAGSTFGFYNAIFKKDKRGLYWGSLSFALLCGIRPQDFLFTVPLYIWAILNAKPKNAFKALVLFGLICLAWFIPLISISGGLKGYLQILIKFFQQSRLIHSIFNMPLKFIKDNTTEKIKMLLLIYGIGVLPLFYQLQSFFNLTTIARDRRVRFFIIWMAPAIIFWLCIYGGNAGYIITTLTGLVVYLAWAIDVTSKEVCSLIGKIKQNTLSWAFVITLITTNSFIFLYDFWPDRKATNEIRYQSRADTKKKDTMLRNKLNYIKANFTPQSTVIITTEVYFMQAMYYLPQYRVYQYEVVSIYKGPRLVREGYNHQRRRYLKDDNSFDFIDDSITTVVLFEEEFGEWIEDVKKIKLVAVGDGYHLYIIKRPTSGKIFFDLHKVFF